MSTHAMTWALLHRRSPRALFLARITRQVRRAGPAIEVARAGAALGALAAWSALLALLGG